MSYAVPMRISHFLLRVEGCGYVFPLFSRFYSMLNGSCCRKLVLLLSLGAICSGCCRRPVPLRIVPSVGTEVVPGVQSSPCPPETVQEEPQEAPVPQPESSVSPSPSLVASDNPLVSLPTDLPLRNIAVLSLHESAVGQIDMFRRIWDFAVMLSPDIIVVLGDVDLSREMEIVCGGIPTGVWLTRAGVPVFLVPGGEATGRKDAMLISCPEQILVFARCQDVAGFGEAFAEWLQTTQAELNSKPVLLFADETDMSPTDHPALMLSDLERIASGLPGEVHGVTGGARRISRFSGPKTTLTQLTDPLPAVVGMPEADGWLSGLLFVRFLNGSPKMTLLRPETVLPTVTFSHPEQEERDRLREGLSCSSPSDLNPISRVRCCNPTSRTLSFVTHWAVQEGRLSVEPEILSFQLEAGEAFEQDFRLTVSGVPRLKFAVPEFSVCTTLQDGAGQPVPMTVSVAPHCRISGTLQRSGTPDNFVVDGSLDEWQGEGWQVGHPSQVVAGREFWGGPEDCSALLYGVVIPRGLIFAIRLQDDDCWGSEQQCQTAVAELLLGPLPGDVDTECSRYPLVLNPMTGGGTGENDWCWRRDTKGLTAEILIPFLSENAVDRLAEVYLELHLTDIDGDDPPVHLWLSGDGGLDFQQDFAHLVVFSPGSANGSSEISR